MEGIFSNSANILVVGHEHPDGDSISSALALKFFFEAFGKQAEIFFDKFSIEHFCFLPAIESVITLEDKLKGLYDLVVGIDYGSEKKLYLPSKNISCGTNSGIPFFVTIDHHLVDSQIGDVKIIKEDRSSTCEVLYEMFKELNFTITKKIADCLLCGIISDTGGLQHKSVSHNTLLAVGDLLEKGAKPYKIVKHLFQNHSVDVLKLWGKILSRIKKDPHNLMSFSIVSKGDLYECGCSIEDLGGLVSIINTNPDTKFTLLLTESDAHLMSGSLRSEDYKGVDVSQIAKVFGGGGHKLASGFKSEENVREILKKIYSVVRK